MVMKEGNKRNGENETRWSGREGGREGRKFANKEGKSSKGLVIYQGIV